MESVGRDVDKEEVDPRAVRRPSAVHNPKTGQQIGT